MSDNPDQSKIPELNYEVDDKVSDQLLKLNKGLLAKPQFWVILAVIVVIVFLIYRRQQLKKEDQANEERQTFDTEAQNNNEQQLDQIETRSNKSADGGNNVEVEGERVNGTVDVVDKVDDDEPTIKKESA